MTVCDIGHDEIVHIEKHCPLCVALEEIGELKKQINDLDNTCEELRQEMNEIQEASNGNG